MFVLRVVLVLTAVALTACSPSPEDPSASPSSESTPSLTGLETYTDPGTGEAARLVLMCRDAKG